MRVWDCDPSLSGSHLMEEVLAQVVIHVNLGPIKLHVLHVRTVEMQQKRVKYDVNATNANPICHDRWRTIYIVLNSNPCNVLI